MLPSDEDIEQSLIETDMDKLPTEKLEEMLAKCIENEEYEEAAKIKGLISKRKG